MALLASRCASLSPSPRPAAPSRGISAQLVASWSSRSLPRGPVLLLRPLRPHTRPLFLLLPVYCDISLPILHRFDDRFARRSHFHSNLKSVEVGLGRPKSGPTFVPVGAWFAPGSTGFCLKAIVSRISLIFLKFSSLILQLDFHAPLLLLPS